MLLRLGDVIQANMKLVTSDSYCVVVCTALQVGTIDEDFVVLCSIYFLQTPCKLVEQVFHCLSGAPSAELGKDTVIQFLR